MPDRSLYLQCFAGLSGDMFLATVLGLGVPEDHLRSELRKLGIEDEYVLRVSGAEKSGINGLRVDVDLEDVAEHCHHSHGHDHSHQHEHSHGHVKNQRNYKAIRELIKSCALKDAIKTRALQIFDEVARAEAKIHDQDVDSVHFHEVGATDSIIDIVGAAIGLEYLSAELKIDRFLCSTLELGSGFVKCQHGDYPVPAPATAQILRGVPVSVGRVKGEATTPTGAAILKACVDEFADRFSGSVQATIYGIGHRDTNVPNVVRAQVVENDSSPAGPDAPEYGFAKIEANIDDMSPEAYTALYESLFEAGASDVFLQNIIMKKSRPAQMLTVLCKADNAEVLGNVVLNNSTTIGLRVVPFKKMVLPRELIEVPTTLGTISVKLVQQPNGIRRWKSEHDQVHGIAKCTGESYLAIKSRVDREIHQYLSDQGYLQSSGGSTKVDANHE